ncbi:hypothetical protein OSB04_003093 [Centaurea solstitialis]|uniref:Uncharacterized protein n=1 Tax=Centaurea solstitialis TaxID=347529 RepID=A0AA38WNE7_9ASTR|nr:hypothetical protein OSB04_003093 [Centaurea solstitialis]
MESISSPIYLNPLSLCFNLSNSPPSILSFPYTSSSSSYKHISKTKTSIDSLRKPTKKHDAVLWKKVSELEQDEEEEWKTIEEQIVEDIAPLTSFVRLILHSGKYENGERLSSDHEHIIIQRILAYHPEMDKKIGCGINYIMVGQHPDFERSRCLFVVRRNGDMVDFSYWKCIEGFIRKKYPSYANNFSVEQFLHHRLKQRS